MMYGLHVMGYVGIALLVSAITSPTIFGEDISSNFIGRSSEDILRAILHNSDKNETNFIFSPFGYSVILGILSEGTRGDTREELTRILHLPEDTATVRSTFRTTLQRLQERSATNVPEFRNYFYVYKNYSIDPDYRTALLENYFTDVRSVDRPVYDAEFEETPTETPATDKIDLTTSKPGYESTDQKIESSTVTSSTTAQIKVQSTISTTSYENLTMQSTTINHSERKERIKSNKKRMKRFAKRFLGIELDETPRSQLSSLSANRLNSGDVTRYLSRMVIFNGLYFRGLWKTPFQYKQGEELFYKSNSEKVMTKMVYAVGQFQIGHIPELDSTVLSVPYKGERYSFFVILPTRKDGLKNVISNVDKLDFGDFRSNMKLRHMQVSLPVFEFKSTSYLKEPLKTLGVRKIFTTKADFSGLSQDTGLFVDNVVQVVTIKVDNESGTPNFLTASNVQTRTVTEKFTADRPFVFFVYDHKDNIIIAGGKLHEPVKEY